MKVVTIIFVQYSDINRRKFVTRKIGYDFSFINMLFQEFFDGQFYPHSGQPRTRLGTLI